MNGRINKLENALQPLMALYLDWQEHNVMNNEDHQLTLSQYVARTSDDEALESIF